MLISAANNSITNPVINTSLQGKTGIGFFGLLLPNLFTLALIIGSIIFVFVMIMGAVQWISSGGDKQALEGAKSKISNAFVGLVIMLAIFAIIKVLENFFGIHILTLDIGALIIK